MRKIALFACCLLALSACDKHDPILPGARNAIFDTKQVNVLSRDITDVPATAFVFDNSACQYSQDASNVIWDGERRVFSGFPTSNSVKSNQRPSCSGNYVYAGLTTGEVVKIAPKSRQIIWVADVYRASNLTGGAPMVDIIAPIIPRAQDVYAAGLGDAFCKLSAQTGAKKWCIDIGTAVPFVLAGNYAFVVATDDYLYAIETNTGDVYWRAPVAEQVAPTYSDGLITVGREYFDVTDGVVKK